VTKQYDTTTSGTDLKFQYADTTDPSLVKLKTISAIILDPAATETEKAKTIIGYAHGLFTHDGDNQPSALDPITIITEAQAGSAFRCVEYSLLAAALLWAYGIPARVVGLKAADVETREYGAGHVVIEFWSSVWQKWVMCDVQAGIIPTAKNILLSAFELSQKIEKYEDASYEPVDGSRFLNPESFGTMAAYIKWVKDYLYFLDTPAHVTFANVDLAKQQIVMLLPLDAAPPKMFQGMFEMNAIYTRSVIDFYAQPLV
jgi:hypothetical protein